MRLQSYKLLQKKQKTCGIISLFPIVFIGNPNKTVILTTREGVMPQVFYMFNALS